MARTPGLGQIVRKMNSVKTILLASALVMIVAGTCGPLPLRAQEQTSTPQKQHVNGTRKDRGPAQELAHETREAAGEEDETAEFKQSASVQWIAKITGMSVNHAFLLSDILNFLVIAALIIWAGRK